MRYEELHGCRLPKVGFGTWSIGGGTRADRNQDAASLAALRSALEMGYMHFDTAESYAAGHCEKLLGQAIRESRADRTGLFLTSKVKPANLSTQNVLRACEDTLRRLGAEYLDLYLIHWPNPRIDLAETFKGLNTLVKSGRARHLGVSNFDLDLLTQARGLSETPVLTNQVPFSVAERSYSRNGVVDFCRANDILVTAYSPFEQGRLQIAPGIAEVAQARSATAHQVAIAWLCRQPGVITIPMSGDPRHQRENLEAADIVLSASELELIG